MSRTPLLLCLSICICHFALATEDSYAFDDRNQELLFLQLTAELRCPMCQNQNIADSDAMIAHDMRRKVYQLLQEGKTEREVIEFMRARYGDFVYYQPPVTPVTALLWLIPIGFVILSGTVFVSRRFFKSEPVSNNKTNDELALAKAQKMLDEER